jgi:integrase
VSDGVLPKTPCSIEGAGTVESRKPDYMSREQAAALINAMPDDMRPVTIVTLLAHLRRGALRRGDVDLRAGTLRIERAITYTKDGRKEEGTKTDRPRVVDLPPQALDVLRTHLGATGPAHHADPLFRHRSGRPLEKHHIRVAWDGARRTTGLTQFRWHDLRHAGLTWAAQEGATLAEVMERGGHRSVAAAMIYQHAAQERGAEPAARLAVPLGGTEAPGEGATGS